MGWEAWFTVSLVVVMTVAMIRGHAPDTTFLGGLAILLAVGILDPAHAFVGFSNEGVLSVAALFVVAAGIRETGALDWAARRVLGHRRGLVGAQVRMMAPVAVLSAFINNTPIVAVATPVVVDWARRIGVSPSKLLIPLSYATILGGTCTLIGTSTNLVVDGLAMRRGLELGLFEIAWVGVPVLAIGLLYILAMSHWLLPDRGRDPTGTTDPRAYGVTMRIETASPVAGRSVEAAGLRHLPGLFLAEIEREGVANAAVGPEMLLLEGDRLFFVGAVDSVADLRRIKGIVPVGDDGLDVDMRESSGRRLVEAVIGSRSSLVGTSVRDAEFRTRFQAAVIAVHRRGTRLASKIGDITLEAGDTLLLEAREGFLERHGRDPDFALAAAVSESEVPRYDRAILAAGILGVMVLAHAVAGVPLATASLLAAGALIATGCLSSAESVRALDLRVLLAIAASFGVGEALAATGAARSMADLLVASVTPLFGPIALLAALYLVTAILTELITNNAAAVLIFPIAAEAAASAGLDLRPFAFLVMMAASASFATPIGYQTNLMVLGPGGYRFSDFLRFGIPLQILLGVVTVALISWHWL